MRPFSIIATATLATSVAIGAVPAAAAPKKVVPHTQVGVATYYRPPSLRGVPAAQVCASPSLAFGTHLTVTNTTTGHSVTCVVADRMGQNNAGRVIDLSTQTFSRLAPLSQGVMHVKLAW